MDVNICELGERTGWALKHQKLVIVLRYMI